MLLDELENLRKLRNLETISLKPSQYIKPTYVDSLGNESPVVLREYQKKHIIEMCQVSRHINAMDTGLGKTLTVLNTIGYIWLKEPDYVPIVVVTKSALFQWKAECHKFMQNMEPVVVHGEPHDRDLVYKQFFQKSDQKRILIMTYDVIFRDLDTSVIKDKSFKANSSDKKALKKAREDERDLKSKLEIYSSALKDITDSKSFDESEYVFARTNGKPAKNPPNWSKSDEEALESVIDTRKLLISAQNEVKRLTDLVSPPLKALGILEHMSEFKTRCPDTKFMLVLDEIHKIKNYRSQVHEKVKAVSLVCDRIIGMTATPVKNRLMEFFGIFKVINPTLFPKVTQFQNDYCVVKLQRVPGGRQVPIVVGYKNLESFVSKIEPYFLARQKYEVAKELPDLISVEVQCELFDLQDELYDMAETGVDNTSDDDSYSDVLSSLVMCQQAVNAPQLILDDDEKPFEGPSSKIDALIDLIQENPDQKIIVFSRFEKMISLIEKSFNKEKINCVRITGKENNPKIRQESREKFQDPKSGINVILITMAGSESLNLQAAEHFVFIDLPWSHGDLAQLLGRMIRIGSTHKTVIAHYYLAVRKDGSDTIDHHVLKALKEKQKLVNKVSGKTNDLLNLVSDSDFTNDIVKSFKERNKPKLTLKSTKANKPKQIKNSSIKVENDHIVESIEITLDDL